MGARFCRRCEPTNGKADRIQRGLTSAGKALLGRKPQTSAFVNLHQSAPRERSKNPLGEVLKGGCRLN